MRIPNHSSLVRLGIVLLSGAIVAQAQKDAPSDMLGEPVGYAWPKKDLRILDTSTTPFKPLISGKSYPLLGREPIGWIVLAEDVNGKTRPALVPFHDAMGNPTVTTRVDEVVIQGNLGLHLRPGSYVLQKARKYKVMSRTGATCSLLCTDKGCAEILQADEADLNFISPAEYRAAVQQILDGLCERADREIRDGKYTPAVFTDYQGRFREETSGDRSKLAEKYWAKFEIAQAMKGLANYEGNWMAAEEAQRLRAFAMKQQQEVARAYAEVQAQQALANKEAFEKLRLDAKLGLLTLPQLKSVLQKAKALKGEQVRIGWFEIAKEVLGPPDSSEVEVGVRQSGVNRYRTSVWINRCFNPATEKKDILYLKSGVLYEYLECGGEKGFLD